MQLLQDLYNQTDPDTSSSVTSFILFWICSLIASTLATLYLYRHKKQRMTAE